MKADNLDFDVEQYNSYMREFSARWRFANKIHTLNPNFKFNMISTKGSTMEWKRIDDNAKSGEWVLLGYQLWRTNTACPSHAPICARWNSRLLQWQNNDTPWIKQPHYYAEIDVVPAPVFCCDEMALTCVSHNTSSFNLCPWCGSDTYTGL